MTRRQILSLLILTVSAPAQPRRIVSTSPSITEILFALGLGPQVVGVSEYCRFPAAVKQLPKVGPICVLTLSRLRGCNRISSYCTSSRTTSQPG